MKLDALYAHDGRPSFINTPPPPQKIIVNVAALILNANKLTKCDLLKASIGKSIIGSATEPEICVYKCTMSEMGVRR